MPEGDTLHRTAAVLARALEGQTIVRVRGRLSPRDQAQVLGQQVTRVTAHGKNLIIAFEGGRALHSHLGMHGSWHLYRPGERWRRPAHDLRVMLDVGDIAALCFGAPTVRLLHSAELAHDPRLAELGPDILAADFDAVEALRRLRSNATIPLGEALLMQTSVAGIGNIYKSETLFSCRANPFATVEAASDVELAAIVQRARELMRANLAPASGMRTTRFEQGERYWVYRRSGLACLVCGSKIRMRRQGEMHRSTYYCAACQRVDELNPAS